MIDPTTTGALVAAALSAGASALAKGAIGQAGKEAYEALKGALMSWAGQDVSKLEERPESESRKAVVAELTDEQSEQERGRIAILAEALVREMRRRASDQTVCSIPDAMH
jgi:hypothetical protein